MHPNENYFRLGLIKEFLKKSPELEAKSALDYLIEKYLVVKNKSDVLKTMSGLSLLNNLFNSNLNKS